MARRGRGSSARPRPGGRDVLVNGSAGDDVDLPGDEPGARTIGAMALKRWAARGPGRGTDDDGGTSPRTHGPYDEEDLADGPGAPHRVDFGAVRVPVPPAGEVSVEPEDGRLQAVHVMLPAGRLSVSALAAPRTERLWPDLAAEIDESLREGGATVRSFTGEWGRELHARTGDASSLFVGVDGPRWMLYGVATGPTSAAAELDAALRTMLRGTVVVRGRSPYPVRTVLPLTIPDRLPHAAPVPVPRRPTEGPPPRRPAAIGPAPVAPPPVVEAPTTITSVPAGLAAGGSDSVEDPALVDTGLLDPALVDTVPHGIPRSVPGTTGPSADDVRPDARAATPDDSANDTGTSAERVSRTASRGLFRRKPERPAGRAAGRPPPRRGAAGIAPAARDPPPPPRRRPPARTRADRDVPATPPPAAAGAASNAPSNGRANAQPNGQEPDRARSNGFIPREPAHDERAPAERTPDAAPNGRYAVNGVAPEEPRRDDTRFGSYTAGAPADPPPRNGSYDGGHHGGLYGGSPAEPSPPEVFPVNGSHDSRAYPAGPAADRHDAAEPFGIEAGPVGAIEATVWASLALGGAQSSSGLPADGSDDWTLPLPVVRPDPAPEPERPAATHVPHVPHVPARSRRARREAGELTAEAAVDRWAPDEWTSRDQAPERWSRDRWTPEPPAADRWGSDPSSRHTRGRHEEPGAGELPRRAPGTRSRHADEGRGEGAEPGGRSRHRRPDL